MPYILLTLSVLLGSARNIFTKKTESPKGTIFNAVKVNTITFAFSFLAVFLIGILNVKTTFEVPWILVLFYAVFTLLNQLFIAKAVSLGSVSLTGLFASCGFVIPTLFGSIYYKEPLNALHIIGIVLIILSFVFSMKKEDGKKFNFGWLLFAIGGLVTAGALGVVQKIFTSDYSGYKLNNFMSMSFALILIANLIALFFIWLLHKKDTPTQTEKTEALTKKQKVLEIIFIAILGVSLGAIHSINTNLSGLLPSAVAFPVINGGVIILTTVLSKLFFKEKLTLLQIVGLIIGVLSIGCITLADALIF